ncbi:ethanolamine ammonia-lyase subunit EutC [Asaia krungthepensis]|uniref:Ethanolamine ammonia-lyase small subunit n=1 Tax=Asaia krungthepensis NRIC 0535 TaxID=1307925 RepID=A0ABQ0Q532_9PROT|nr:ethanolamine ammonia-lyase subunit EutC [Asaia krungthepensis]GBQ91773.1 ethanolamine ammonia-lyase small subunit [Asaia krungthepensis NRIC 0535]
MTDPVNQEPPREIDDPWRVMRAATRARIGLGRSGNGQVTRDVLAFQADHARARDAVHTPLDTEALRLGLRPRQALTVTSAAKDRPGFLGRPDLGRRLGIESRECLERGDWDLVFVLGDGLSAQAVSRHGPSLVASCCDGLPGWRIAPPIIALQCRVALGDDIAACLGARMVAVLIGERPGLTVSDSMGVYLTHAPAPGTPDSKRNCLSNIHDHGLSPAEATVKLLWLINEARRLGLTGVELKERTPQAPSELQREEKGRLAP